MTKKKENPKRGGHPPKFDYEGEEFLSMIEGFAKNGLTDTEIANAIGLNPSTFSTNKTRFPKMGEVLTRARCKINASVRATFLRVALGGKKLTNTTYRKIRDRDGNETGEVEIQTTESEMPPSLQALSVWLFHHDPEWRKVEMKDFNEDIPTDTDKGIDIEAWIKKELELE